MTIRGNFENAIWDVPGNWQIKEDYLNEGQQKNIVDGKNILAVVEGVFFVPNGVSRNERYYPKTFWETILNKDEVKSRLNNRIMFGEIGHNDRPVSEGDLTDGRVSHIVTKLWIDEQDRGMGQAYILGTPAGKNLYTYMKAGCQIKTSSRASGDYKSNEDYNGMPIVDEDTYYLETFDFVINPGFLETNPKLMENVNKIKKQMEKKEMEYGKELFELLKEEKVTLSEKVENVSKNNTLLESENKKLSEKVEELESKVKELSESEDLNETIKKEINEVNAKNQELTEKLKGYEELGEAEDIKTTLDESANLLEEYVAIGKPEAIKKELSESKKLIESYKVFGTAKELEETIPVVEKVLERYSKLGSLEEVEEIIKRAEELTKKIKQERFDDTVIKISREYKAPIENVKKLLEKVGEVETVEILKSVSKGNKKIVSEEERNKKVANKVKVEERKEKVNENVRKPIVSDLFRTLKRGQ